MNQAGGLFLAPLQAALVAVHTDAQGVFFPGADLARNQHATGTPLHLEQHGGIVVQLTALDVHAQVGAQVGDGLIDHELRQRKGMGTDVADAAAQPGQLRLPAPLGLLVALPGHILAEPALRILHQHFAHGTDDPAAHHLSRLPDHRVAEIGMGQAIQPGAAAQSGCKRLQLREVQCCWLLAEHMKSRSERLAGHRCV
ncbi:hypothetical protein D3C73_762130 [compost metagenome]